MYPDFGANIYSYMFENVTKDTLVKVQEQIENAIKKWMPYLSVQINELIYNEDQKMLHVDLTFKYSVSESSIIVNISLGQ